MSEYLNNLAWLFQRHRFGMTRTLDTTHKLLAYFGDPHDQIPAVHVAGTNGKGSTCAMITSNLQAAGFRTGMYTSPHLVDWRERIRIDGNLVPVEIVAQLLASIRPLADSLHATFFEVTTALAFQVFREMRCDFNVIETGLGGTWDCTNVLHPVVAHLTRIDLDHTEILGNTRLEIARDKSGIWKPESYATSSKQTTPVEKFLKTRWQERKAKSLRLASETIKVTERRVKTDDISQLSGQFVTIHPISEEATREFWDLPPLYLPLLGKHQLENLAGVFCILLGLREAGCKIDNEAIVSGLGSIAWYSRMQVHGMNPLTISDAAHNPAGAKALVKTLLEKFPLAPPSRYRVVLSLLADKDIDSYICELAQLNPVVYAATLEGSRGRYGSEIAHYCTKYGLEATSYKTPQDALSSANKMCYGNDIVVITGSHYLIGAILEIVSDEQK